MSSDETITTTLRFDVEGIDRSIGKTQRYLYLFNAFRLSMVDLQQLSKDPSLGKLLWTTIQLTRTWTHLHRIIKMANKAQQAGAATSLLRAAARGKGVGGLGVEGTGLAMRHLFEGGIVGPSMFQILGGALGTLAMVNPYLTIAALTVSALGYRQYFMDRKRRTEIKEWRQEQREIFKTLGYDY